MSKKKSRNIHIERISTRLLVNGRYVAKVGREGQYLLADDEHPPKQTNTSQAVVWAWRIARKAANEGKSIRIEQESTRIYFKVHTTKRRLCTIITTGETVVNLL